MKKHLITALLAVLVTVSYAANNFGKDYFGIGEYNKAKEYFESHLSDAPAESNYYLGEIAWAGGQADLATSYFDKGIAADPLYPLNFIGKGKVILKANQKEAEAIFSAALKKNKKNSEVNVAIARAYYENDLKSLVPIKLEIARKFGKKAPYVYIFEGDMLAAAEKFGEAAGKYETATYFDPTNVVAGIKCAQVYEGINSKLAIEKLQVLLAAHPDYTVINRNLGRAYTSAGMYKSAIESFVTYYGVGNCAFEDLYRLASAYYYSDKYAESVVVLDQGLEKDSNDFVLNRFRMYCASKMKDTIVGLPVAKRFFSIQGHTFLDKDYSAYAIILAEVGKYTEALIEYDKVISANAAKPETYKELAPIYTKMKDYAKAAESFQKYIDMIGIDAAEGSDYYSMGRSWYLAGQAFRLDSTDLGKATAKAYFVKADTAFGVVSIKSPLSHIGYLWRGHANAALDPETSQGLAKPYYEKSLELILKKIEDGGALATYRKDMIRIYLYEGVYFYQKQMKDSALYYANKVLEIAPDNADALNLIDSYKPPVVKTVMVKVPKSKKQPVSAGNSADIIENKVQAK
jgi:tetratricopeptide (TPR) repeat protein